MNKHDNGFNICSEENIKIANLKVLAEIHNRLAEISSYLNIAVTKFAKLDVEDKEAMWDHEIIPFFALENNDRYLDFFDGSDLGIGYSDFYNGLYMRTGKDFVFGDREHRKGLYNEYTSFKQQLEDKIRNE